MTADDVCYAGPHFFWWFPVIPLFFLGFWLIVLLLVRPWAWRRRGPWAYGTGSAEGVLAERYARGEVTEEEYRSRLEVLRRDR